MKIVVAPDKFRGSLQADEVCLAVADGARLAYPDADIISIPLADGGEGTMPILTRLKNGFMTTATVQDPLGRHISASYGLSADGTTAYIEMAAASGLRLLDEASYNPMLTSTYGTGELLLDAVHRGARHIILGIGGSATTDGGIGMAAALGYRFYDIKNELLSPVGGNMVHIARIDASGLHPAIKMVNVTVACDVTNPLFGPQGAAYIYGPQKGADPPMVEALDSGLRNLSEAADHAFGKNISQNPGAGAAGGLGAGCLWFLNAALKEGASIVMEEAGVAAHIRQADLVITGEGKVDEQTLNGKVVKSLAGLCREEDVPLVVVCGTLLISSGEISAAGIVSAVSVLNRPMDLETAQRDAYQLVKEATFNLVRLFFSKRSF